MLAKIAGNFGDVAAVYPALVPQDAPHFPDYQPECRTD